MLTLEIYSFNTAVFTHLPNLILRRLHYSSEKGERKKRKPTGSIVLCICVKNKVYFGLKAWVILVASAKAGRDGGQR